MAATAGHENLDARGGHTVDDDTRAPSIALSSVHSRSSGAPSLSDTDNNHDFKKPERFAASLWATDEITAAARLTYAKILLVGCTLVVIVIFAVLSIYWGSLSKVNGNVHHFNGWIVDFDGGVIGQTVTQALLNATGPPESISWEVVDAAQFTNGPDDVANAVAKERCWAAVTINPEATNTLNAAIAGGNSSYNGSLAVTAYAEEARNENSYPIFIVPNIQGPLNKAVEAFAQQNARQIAANGSIILEALLAQAPSVVTQPLFFTIDNIRPFDVPVATAVDFVGLIYLLILSFIVAMMNYNARVIRSGLGHHLHRRSLILLRLYSPIVLYFFISAFYAMLSLAFQTPFNRVFGGWGFVIFWMVNWMGMCALGLAMEAMITLLTPAFVPFFLVLWIIANVSVSFFPIPLLPGVFKYGYAMPFYNVSRAVRTIVFDTRNQIGLNFGVLIAWIAVSMVTIPIFQFVIRRRDERKWYASQNNSEEKA